MSNIRSLVGYRGVDTQSVAIPFAEAVGDRLDAAEASITALQGTGSGNAVIAAGTPTEPVAAALTTALAGANNDLVFTAATKGVAGNAITIEYADPGADSQLLAVTVIGTDIKVDLATDAGDAAAATLTEGTVVTLANAGSSYNTFSLAVATQKSVDGFGVDFPMPSQSLAAAPVVSETIELRLATDAGTAATLTVTDATGAGEVTLETKAAYAGAWANTQVTLAFEIADNASENLGVDLNDNGAALDVVVQLGTDVNGLPDAAKNTDDLVAAAINTAFAALSQATGLAWTTYLVATGGTAGYMSGVLASAPLASGVNASSNIVANAAATVETELLTLAEIATAAGGAGNVVTEETVPFAGGGANYAITSTAALIDTEIDNTPAALALCVPANAGGNNGTGVVTALAETALIGGVNGTTGNPLEMLADTNFIYISVSASTIAVSNWKKAALA